MELGQNCLQVAEVAAVEGAGEAAVALMRLVAPQLPCSTQKPTGLMAPAALPTLPPGPAPEQRPGPPPQQALWLLLLLHTADRLSWLRLACQLAAERLPSGRQPAPRAHALQPLLRLRWAPEMALEPLQRAPLLLLGLGLALALTAPALRWLYHMQQAPELELGRLLRGEAQPSWWAHAQVLRVGALQHLILLQLGLQLVLQRSFQRRSLQVLGRE